MTTTGVQDGARVLLDGEGLVVGDRDGVRDRFMIDGKDTGGRFALVQHLFAPRALAAPYRCDADMDETQALLARHDLSF